MFVKAVLLSLSVAFCLGQDVLNEEFQHWGCDYEKPCVFAYNLVFPMGPNDNFLWQSIPVNVAPCDKGCAPMRTTSAIVRCKGYIKKCKNIGQTECRKAWCICEYWFSAWVDGLPSKANPKQKEKKFYFEIYFFNPPYEFGCRPNDSYNPCDCTKVLILDSNKCYLDMFTCMPSN